jgi:hypothetical protein
MANGGARPGAGRKPGGVNRVTKEAIERAQEGGEMPLDYLLRIMRDVTADEAKRIDCAKAAAPYVHAKLNSIEAKFEGDLNITEVGWVIRAKPGD